MRAKSQSLVGGGLGGGGKDAVEAEVHGLGGVVVCPRAGSHKDHASARKAVVPEERDGIIEMRVVKFGEGGGAEIERTFHRRDELVFGIGLGEFRNIGSGYASEF